MSFHFSTTEPSGLPGTHANAGSCPRCATNLTLLPEAASFCPRCGLDLYAHTTVSQETGRGAKIPVRATIAVSKGNLDANALLPLSPDSESRSAILRGFANALFRLGSRYETSLGAQNNPDEAMRCYFKAAKLGNSAAQAKLGVPADCENPQSPS